MVNNTVKKIVNGDVMTAAKLIRDIDDQVPETREILKALHGYTGKAYIIGVTGAPGVGKSTIVDQMVRDLRLNGKTVGVLAVDPTSPFSGGAILGDRIRMQRHSLDKEVFIRSLATRGQFGGLTQSTLSAIDVLDAMGKEYIIVETVGVGQGEVDIARCVHTTVIVVVPGLGDHVQAIKAGIFEVGDIFVVNKADRPEAERAVSYLRSMIGLAKKEFKNEGWEPSIIMAEALNNKGIIELLNEIEKHRRSKKVGDILVAGKRDSARIQLTEMIKSRLIEETLNRITGSPEFEKYLDCIMERTKDPYTACDELLSAMVFGLSLDPCSAPNRTSNHPDEND